MPSPFSVNTIGLPFTELSEVDSTNNYAMAQARAGLATHGAAWFAHHQTAGKGRRGKSWSDARGQSIILSVLLDTSALLVSDQFRLSAAVALAAHDLVSHHVDQDIKIKWPNDIYWRDKKAAGILIENIIQGNKWQKAVVGIGININQTGFDTSLANPVSLKQITGKSYDVVALAKELCGHLQQRYDQLLRGDLEDLLEAYNAVLYKRNESVKLKKSDAIFDCTIKEVNAQGQLLISGATEARVGFDEVEWIMPIDNS